MECQYYLSAKQTTLGSFNVQPRQRQTLYEKQTCLVSWQLLIVFFVSHRAKPCVRAQ